jgi:hypothetical protein
VRTGGRLRSPVGELAMEAVDVIDETGITESDANLAGFPSRSELIELLNRREETLYRISFHLAGPDWRIALRENTALAPSDIDALKAKLSRMDRNGAWTMETLRMIQDRPAVRAAQLAAAMGSDTKPFKIRVRKLKELGLTESLVIGYKLSPRGETLLRALTEQ